MLSQLYERHEFKEDDEITITKIENDNFELKVNS